MPVVVTHPFVSPVVDEGDPNEVGPNEWNAEHTIVGLGTAAEADSADFATAAQGAKADTALQTASDSAEINFTVVGQDITASLVAASIDEAKLDASVNASLDLADSALQAAAIANMLETGDIGVSVQAWSANLDEYAAINPTAAGLALLDDANAAAQLVTLGLTATAAELNFTDGVTSAIQAQLDGKIGGTTGATDNRVLRSDGTGTKTAQATGITVDDANYVTGVSRLSLDQAPVYDLASSVLAAQMLVPLAASTLTVAASKRFNGIRFTQSDGNDVAFTVGASSEVTGVYSSLTSASGSDATANVYGMVAHATNAGPGTTRGLHAGGYGSGTSSGPLNAVAGEITPVATQGYTSAFFAALNSSGVHDKAIGFAAESGNGDRYLVAFGNGLAALPINVAYFRAWMATGSSTNARAFSVLNNGGSEIAYWHKDGSITAAVSVTAPSIIGTTDLIAASASNGITITQAAVSRNHVNGSLTFAAGTAAGNTFAIATGGSTRFDVSDTASRANGYIHALLGTAIPAGGTAGAGYRLSTTSNFGIFFGSGAPTLSAAQGSLYLRSDGSSTSTRLYVNSTGSTTWVNFTSAS